MAKEYKDAVLNQPIAQLEASEAFKKITQDCGYQTLSDLLQLGNGYELLKHRGFNYHLINEYVSLLEKYGVAHYLN